MLCEKNTPDNKYFTTERKKNEQNFMRFHVNVMEIDISIGYRASVTLGLKKTRNF